MVKGFSDNEVKIILKIIK